MFCPSLARLLLRVVTIHSLGVTLPAIEALDANTAGQLRRELAEQAGYLALGRAWLDEAEAELIDLAESGLRAGWLTPNALTSLIDSRREADIVPADLRLWIEAARDATLPER